MPIRRYDLRRMPCNVTPLMAVAIAMLRIQPRKIVMKVTVVSPNLPLAMDHECKGEWIQHF